MEEVKVPLMPRIGDKAPDFEAMTTTGPIRFSDYIKGHWSILFSHPADFTPVCTTEMSAFAKDKNWFAQHQTKLIGLSIDSIHSHLAWVNNVREKTDVYLDFPIIADLDMKVAQLYGMLHPGESTTAAVRAVFFIDPEGIIRLIMYYPFECRTKYGTRSKGLSIALQTADKCKCALPVNWKPGEKAIVPPPKTLVEMEERIANTEYEKVDFYLARKAIEV